MTERLVQQVQAALDDLRDLADDLYLVNRDREAKRLRKQVRFIASVMTVEAQRLADLDAIQL